MRATSALVRAACALASTGAHVLAFAAFAPLAPRAVVCPPLDERTPVAESWDVDVSPLPDEPTPKPAETAPASSRATSVVARNRPTRSSSLPAASPNEVPMASSAAAPARFVLAVTDRASETSTGAGHPAPAGALPGVDGSPLPEERVSVPARLTAPVEPRYPVGARAEQIEADVDLGIIVAASGQVVDARIVRPAGYGFDEAALRAIRTARFRPAERDGHPVAVRMRWSVSFRLR